MHLLHAGFFSSHLIRRILQVMQPVLTLDLLPTKNLKTGALLLSAFVVGVDIPMKDAIGVCRSTSVLQRCTKTPERGISEKCIPLEAVRGRTVLA